MSDMTGASVLGPDFHRFPFTHDGRTHDVFRAGSGPAVIVVHEIPGIHPGVVDLARRVVAEGHTVYLPSLFGRPGAPAAGSEVLRTVPRVCVSREFAILADRTSPVVSWLRALAVRAHEECGGPGVGALGMCLTGGFALGMAVQPAVIAPVLSQPGLPAPVTGSRRAAIGLDRADAEVVRERAGNGLCALGLRFTADKACPEERFAFLRGLMGEGFEAVEIDSSPGNAFGIPTRAHAVLTAELVDEPGHPTRQALDRVLQFLRERLAPAEPG